MQQISMLFRILREVCSVGNRVAVCKILSNVKQLLSQLFTVTNLCQNNDACQAAVRSVSIDVWYKAWSNNNNGQTYFNRWGPPGRSPGCIN